MDSEHPVRMPYPSGIYFNPHSEVKCGQAFPLAPVYNVLWRTFMAPTGLQSVVASFNAL